DANIIFGAVIDDTMGDQLRITVIATGFGEEAPAAAVPHADTAFVTRRQAPAPAAAPQPPSQPEARRAPTPIAPAAAAAPAPAARPVGREYGPRRVVKMGLIVDDGENPVWHRRQKPDETDEAIARAGNVVEDESEYDIPTFLRKQAD